MKIIIDAMVLGAGYANSTGKTGVFRVVDQLIKGLSHNSNCTLSLIATNRYKQSKAYLKSNKSYKQKLSYPTLLDKIIEKGGSKFDSLHMVERSWPSTNLEKLLDDSDVYHSPYSPIPEIAKRRNAKLFLTVHDLIPILHPNFFSKNEQPLVKVAVDSIINEGSFFCVSESTKNDLCTVFPINPKQVFVTHLAASHSLFYQVENNFQIQSVQKKYNIPTGPYFLSLCTFEPRKNIDHTIRCFVKLLEQQNNRDLNLVLIGSKGWNFENIFSELSKNDRYRSRIIITGFVDDKDLASLYSGAIGFVYPSFYEGFGLPPLEAMQCGIPVITSNTSSLPEVLGGAGILVNPTDEDELCSAMLHLYNDSSFREDLSFKSINQAKKFTWESFINKTIEGYKSAI